MEEDQLMRIVGSDVRSVRLRGMTRAGWMDKVVEIKVVKVEKGMKGGC